MSRTSINRFAEVIEKGMDERPRLRPHGTPSNVHTHSTRSRVSNLHNLMAELRDAMILHAAKENDLTVTQAAALVVDLASGISAQIIAMDLPVSQITAALLHSMALSLRALQGESLNSLNSEGVLGISSKALREALKERDSGGNMPDPTCNHIPACEAPEDPNPPRSNGIQEVFVVNEVTGQRVAIPPEAQKRLEEATTRILHEAGVVLN